LPARHASAKSRSNNFPNAMVSLSEVACRAMIVSYSFALVRF
jgi:hypothetical protein